VSKAAPRFVFFGAQGEYVLGPLAAEMRARGHNCPEIVAREGVDAIAEMAALGGHAGPTVLLTSAHFLHDTESMVEFLGIPACPPLLSVIDALKPDRLVYYPHDLSTPLLWDEHQYAHRIDLYLAATDTERMLTRQMRVEVVGWIKLRHRAQPPDRRGRALWLCMGTETVVRRIGARRTFDIYRPLLRDWCAMKLPPYDYCRPLQDLFAGEGAPVVDCFETPPDHVPHYDVVVSNGPSSVVREAGMMGKPVFIVTDPAVFPQRYLREMADFADMPNVRFVPGIDDVPETAPSVKPRLKPFEMDRAIALITGLIA
jgi:hypothetical protein